MLKKTVALLCLNSLGFLSVDATLFDQIIEVINHNGTYSTVETLLRDRNTTAEINGAQWVRIIDSLTRSGAAYYHISQLLIRGDVVANLSSEQS